MSDLRSRAVTNSKLLTLAVHDVERLSKPSVLSLPFTSTDSRHQPAAGHLCCIDTERSEYSCNTQVVTKERTHKIAAGSFGFALACSCRCYLLARSAPPGLITSTTLYKE